MKAEKYKRSLYDFIDFRESKGTVYKKGVILCDVYEKGTDIYRATIPTERIIE